MTRKEIEDLEALRDLTLTVPAVLWSAARCAPGQVVMTCTADDGAEDDSDVLRINVPKLTALFAATIDDLRSEYKERVSLQSELRELKRDLEGLRRCMGTAK